MSTATEWQTYFDHVGFDNHDDLTRLAIWLSELGYKIEDYSRPTLPELVEIEAEHFLGQYQSTADFAEESISNAYNYELEALPTDIRNAIDWAQVYDRYLRFDCLDAEVNDTDGYRWLIWHKH